jgi:hypothetical protein
LPLFALAQRKPFLLRVDPALLEDIQRWANDDLRSLNGQIEFLLKKALAQSGRRHEAKPATAEPAVPETATESPEEAE